MEFYNVDGPALAILDYYKGMAICRDEFHDLYYEELPEEIADQCTGIGVEDLTPIQELPSALQEEIKARIAGREDPYET